MLDLVIRGGQVITPQGVGTWDVGIEGERIVAVAAPGTLSGDAALRFADVTASPRIRPDLICGMMGARPSIAVGIWPPTRSVTAGAAPL